ncbi:transposase [Streptomyces parvus]|uniref:transposase n=1 Tax=Streptomyces parvus TaxID=66428 RepID=UPI003826E632
MGATEAAPVATQCRCAFVPCRLADRGYQHDWYKEAAETIRTVFAQSATDAVRTQLDTAANMRGTQFPKVRTMLLEAEDGDLTAFAGSPERHRAKTRSTNPPERINREVKRRTGVVQVFPNDDALLWLITAVLFELHDEWTLDAGVRHAGHGTAASRARAVTTIMSALSVASSTVSAERPEITVPVRRVTSCARSCSRMATRRHRQLWARVERFFVTGGI